ncbi:hypothetical protein [Rufibacter sp. DG15C]|uniref:hypothetical protein n=1 Tax=Rufibacter sp. DG15C TaxID=1379909 RepID=UPI001E2C02DE|nr:hypothetical protein [Rufibacter sp. DG15C]
MSSNLKDANYNGNSFTGVGGSPFLSDKWASGKVKLADGSNYTDLKLKYNVENNQVFLLTDNNEVKTFQFPVTEFTLSQGANEEKGQERVFRNGFPSIDDANAETYYEVLADGNTKLLKRTFKTIVAERSPSATTPTNVFKTKEKYYVLRDGEMVNTRTVKKSVLTTLSNKAVEIEKYMQLQKINMLDEKALAKIVTYYNSL